MQSKIIKCDACDTIFTNKVTLNRHIKSAQYCLKIRQEKASETLICEFCNKEFTQKFHLQKHLNKCQAKSIIDLHDKEIDKLKISYEQKIANLSNELDLQHSNHVEKIAKYKEINDELVSDYNKRDKDAKAYYEKITKLTKDLDMVNEENSKLKTQLLELEKEKEIAYREGRIVELTKIKPGVKNITNININPKLAKLPINNIPPLTIQLLNDNLSNYTYISFIRCQEGLIEFIKSLIVLKTKSGVIIERNYVNTDRSRKSFHILDEDDEKKKYWRNDGQAEYITNYVLDSIKGLVKKHYTQFMKELFFLALRERKGN
jgi:uncharacterized C2H2 Zn-finger protein